MSSIKKASSRSRASDQKLPFDWKLVVTPLHIWTVVLVFILDQVSKYWVLFKIEHGFERVPVWEPWFAFVHVKNPGAAFGLFADLSLVGRILIFGSVTVVCVWLLIYWMGTTPKVQKWQRFAFALILGGALGNLKDRIIYQEVTDFIAVRIPMGFLKWFNSSNLPYYDWPTFNVADMGISTGVGIVLFLLLMESRQASKRRAP